MASAKATSNRILRGARVEQLQNVGAAGRAVDGALKKTTRLPKAIQISYSGFLVSAQRVVNKFIREELRAMRSILERRQDDLNDEALSAFEALKRTVGRLSSSTEGLLRLGVVEHGRKTAAFNAKKYDSTVMDMLGIGNASASVESTVIRGWAAENVALITNMNTEQLGKIETLFLRSLRDGSRSSQVTAEVASVLDVSVNRARLIARDQIGKLNGQLDRQKQTESGLDSYIWRGALDARERPTHVAREGKVFQWDSPPPGGHPGQDVLCRCTAEPDLTDLLGEEFAAEPTPKSSIPTDADRAAHQREQAAKRRGRAKRAKKLSAAAAAPAPKPKPKPTKKKVLEKKKTAPPKRAATAKPKPVAPAPPSVKLPKVTKGERSQLLDILGGVTESTGDKGRKLARKLVDKGLAEGSFRGGVKFRDLKLTPKGRALLEQPELAPAPTASAVAPAPTAGRLTDKQFVTSLDTQEANTLGVWKSNAGYDRIRKVQSGKLKGSSSDLNHLARMQSMADRAPKFKGRMFRGLDKVDPGVAKSLATKGAEIELESWTSFTSSSRTVSQFSENVRGKAWVRYSVEVKKGDVFDPRKALASSKVGSRSGIKVNENEVLAPKGAKYRVKSSAAVREKGEVVGYKVQLEEI